MNWFEELIAYISSQLGLSLQTDKGSICKLVIEESFHMQLEHESSYERLLIASFLAELPPGKFREDVLKAGLKANHPLSRFGQFAYSEKNNALAYFVYLSDKESFEHIFDLLLVFIETAKTWKRAIERGELHILHQDSGSSLPPPMM